MHTIRSGLVPSDRESFNCKPSLTDSNAERSWFVAFTLPQHEKAVARQLSCRSIESYLPTYESERVWKNRQRVTLNLPLFPSYIFVRIARSEQTAVLRSPGVVRMVGSAAGPVPIADSVIAVLRSDVAGGRFRPYQGLAIGQRVRVKTGAMEGLEGILMRRKGDIRFVLRIELISQQVSFEVDANWLELIA